MKPETNAVCYGAWAVTWLECQVGSSMIVYRIVHFKTHDIFVAGMLCFTFHGCSCLFKVEAEYDIIGQ